MQELLIKEHNIMCKTPDTVTTNLLYTEIQQLFEVVAKLENTCKHKT